MWKDLGLTKAALLNTIYNQILKKLEIDFQTATVCHTYHTSLTFFKEWKHREHNMGIFKFSPCTSCILMSYRYFLQGEKGLKMIGLELCPEKGTAVCFQALCFQVNTALCLNSSQQPWLILDFYPILPPNFNYSAHFVFSLFKKP